MFNCEFIYHDDIDKVVCKHCFIKLPGSFKDKKIVSHCRKLNHFQLAGKYAKAFLQHSITGFNKTPQDLKDLRLSICNSCRHLAPDKESCLLCGCNLEAKASWNEQECPVYKWPKDTKDSMLYWASKSDADIPINLRGFYNGATVFFIGCGPSLKSVDLSIFSRERGLMTMAVNNIAARDIKPNLWISADDPIQFHENIWRDPTIMKFVRRSNYYKPFRTGEFVRNQPNVFYFDINEDFDSNNFLTEPTVNFGCHSNSYDEFGNKGGRCVMLMSLKILYYLGFKYIYLLGCDFEMKHEHPYAFEQGKHAGGCASNNDKFRMINERLTALAPKFKEKGITVKNCTPNSKLTAFEYKDLNTVLGNQYAKFDKNPNLTNMYGNA